jgi:hypothetical protein
MFIKETNALFIFLTDDSYDIPRPDAALPGFAIPRRFGYPRRSADKFCDDR